MGATPTFHLYIDDTGTRCPDRRTDQLRKDGMDHFAFGGYIVSAEDAALIDKMHHDLMTEFGVTSPLHSTAIRGRKEAFSWLRDAESPRVTDFYEKLNQFVVCSPIIATACVVHRPGYMNRYMELYGRNRWKLCKSAYSILLERACKFAKANDRKLAVYVEQTGKTEDAAIKEYHRGVFENGMPFNESRSSMYSPMECSDFQNLLLKNPKFITKVNPRIQLADLIAYAVAKGQYTPEYRAYKELKNRNMLIDDQLPNEKAVQEAGIKRYCFDE